MDLATLSSDNGDFKRDLSRKSRIMTRRSSNVMWKTSNDQSQIFPVVLSSSLNPRQIVFSFRTMYILAPVRQNIGAE